MAVKAAGCRIGQSPEGMTHNKDKQGLPYLSEARRSPPPCTLLDCLERPSPCFRQRQADGAECLLLQLAA